MRDHTYAGYTREALLSVTLDPSTIEALCEEIDRLTEWSQLSQESMRADRERIAKLAEEWAGGSYAHTECQFRRFAAVLREEKP